MGARCVRGSRDAQGGEGWCVIILPFLACSGDGQGAQRQKAVHYYSSISSLLYIGLGEGVLWKLLCIIILSGDAANTLLRVTMPTALGYAQNPLITT